MLALDLPERINLTSGVRSSKVRRRCKKIARPNRLLSSVWSANDGWQTGCYPRWVANHVEEANLHHGPGSVCHTPRRERAKLSSASHHSSGAFPRWWSERCCGAHRDGGDGENPRAIDGDRERRRGWWYDRQRPRGSREPGRLHLARGQHGFPCFRSGANTKRQIRLRTRFRTDWFYRARAGGDRRKEGFPGEGSARIRGLPEKSRRRREAGARRHRRIVAHGMPAVRLRGRRAAEPGCLSRHRPSVERSDRWARRLFLRAGGQRRSADRGWHDQGLRHLLQPTAGGATERADGEGSRRRLPDEHLGRDFRAQGYAEGDHRQT